MDICVYFTKSKNFWSRAIGYFTFSNHSHVFITIGQREDAYEALFRSGVIKRKLEYALIDKHVVNKICIKGLDEETLFRLQLFLEKNIGKPYDISSILKGIFRKKYRWYNEDAWYCSELIAAAFRFAGLMFFSDFKKIITPVDIETALLSFNLGLTYKEKNTNHV